MTRSRLLIVLLAAGFAWGVIYLLSLQFESGEVYPEYSSLRADPLGSKLLFDTLARVPGVAVSRNFTALSELAPGTTVLLLGWRPAGLAEDAEILRETAGRGVRVVAAMDARAYPPSDVLDKSWGAPAGDRPRIPP